MKTFLRRKPLEEAGWNLPPLHHRARSDSYNAGAASQFFPSKPTRSQIFRRAKQSRAGTEGTTPHKMKLFHAKRSC